MFKILNETTKDLKTEEKKNEDLIFIDSGDSSGSEEDYEDAKDNPEIERLIRNQESRLVRESEKEFRERTREAVNEEAAVAKEFRVPTFEGKHDESIDDWLFIINTSMASRKISEKAILPLMVSLLRGEALGILKKFMKADEGDIFNWPIFSELLRERFEEKDLQRKLWERLSSLDMRSGFRN